LALAPGTRLGVYEITAPIGVGGMGEVYRATDTSLKRSVAIKVLPASVAGDADRLARFQREAEVLAALNHPNIAAIYGLEKTGDVTALVMELVEGEDVSLRLARGSIPVDEALPIAKQIAEALEAAHEQGIIHRDLKPANIKVRTDGMVKVLDFGLAKALDQASASSLQSPAPGNLTASPTVTTPAMTQAGTILGTAAYMAPEQARGKTVDRRADIWAFGAVLFEMLAGKRAFSGDDVQDTFVAIVRDEPDWSALPAATPAALRRLLTRCLKKDPKSRLRDIGEARILIEEIISGVAPDAESPKPESRSLRPVSGWRQMLPWAVTAAALAAAVMLWAPWRSEKPVDRPLVRLDVDLGADVAFPPANNLAGRSIAISPDSTRLVYLSGTPTKLFIRRLDQPKSTELPGTGGAVLPFFSPDGQWVGFGANGKVNKISVEGGAVVPLAEVAGFAGTSWAEDGSIVVSEALEKGLLLLSAAGGAPTIVAPLGKGEAALAGPQLLPGGKTLLFAGCGIGGADNCNIEVLTLPAGHRKILVRGGQSPRYLPSSNGIGHLLYLNKATLFAVPFDPNTLETRGTAAPVVDDVAYAPTTGEGLFDVSRSGTLIYRRSRGGDAAAMATLRWGSPSDGTAGKKELLRATPGAYQDPRLSPDGRRIAVAISDGANNDLWVYDPQRDAITRLTFGGDNRYPVWSPDGQNIVFAKLGLGVVQTRADGASQPQALTGSKTLQIPWSFTPDGKRLAYFEVLANPQIWTVPLDGQGGRLNAGTPERFLKSTANDSGPSFSPDGRWLAYHSNESGKGFEVYVRAFPPPSASSSSAGQGKWQISNSGGSNPHWSRTGNELVYRAGNQLMMVSYAVNGNNFVADKPRVWIAALGGAGGTDWDLAPDGRRVAVVIPEGAAEATQPEHEIVMLLNFADELRRRVPIK
jgi:serine/threonine protein kinase